MSRIPPAEGASWLPRWLDWLNPYFEWAQANATLVFVVVVVTAVGSVIAVPLVVANLPADFFLRKPRRERRRARVEPPPTIGALLRKIAKNVVGVILLLLSLPMLVGPGQGLLTLFLGLSLVDFPGKRALERSLIRRKPIRAGLQWMRRRMGKTEFLLERGAAAGGE